jgi:quinol-cytochrome oxidoreductase complex cytochrome b subunit
VRETLRQENARIYAEMREEGVEPFHESWKSAAVLVVIVVTMLAALFLAFALVVGLPVHAINEFFKNLFH